MLGGLVSLVVGEDTRANEDTDGKALRPHTGLDDLLRRSLVLVGHDDRASDAHADCPAAKDDLVLVLYRPLLQLSGRRQLLPMLLLLRLDALEFTDTGTCPCGLVEFDATTLRLDSEQWYDDEDGGKSLELYGESAERR